MNTWNERITKARLKAGFNKSAFAKAVGVSAPTVTDWESGKIKNLEGRNLMEVCRVLKITPNWLLTGSDAEQKPKIESNATFIADKIAPWDSSTPLDDDEVEVPFYTEVELAAGNGSLLTTENRGPKLRFSKATLKRSGVSHNHAVCVSISGNSMEPVLPDGCTVGIDTSQTDIRDGKMYAIRQGDMVRIKLLYRLPAGGLRLRSHNRDEHPDEEYKGSDAADIVIIGRIFWSSTLW